MSGAIGLLHPGAMGATVGSAARAGGARVLWCGAGRSEATQRRADEAGLEDAGTLADLVAASDAILSVCPPHAAAELADQVAALGFAGLYVDCNAVSAATARAIGARIEAAGGAFVDGGLIGPPVRRAGTTRLYLSGARAPEVAARFAGSPLEAIPLDGPAGAASALKMCFAAWTKGSAALLAAVRALATAEGVDDALLAEWARSLPDLPARSEGSLRGTAAKAWRFVGEMEEIAASFADAGLPDGHHRAAAETYRRLARFRDAAEPPTLAEAIAALLSIRARSARPGGPP